MFYEQLLQFVVNVLKHLLEEPNGKELLAKYKPKIMDVLNQVGAAEEILKAEIREKTKEGQENVERLVYLNKYSDETTKQNIYVITAYVRIGEKSAKIYYRTRDLDEAKEIYEILKEKKTIQITKIGEKMVGEKIKNVTGSVKITTPQPI